MMPKLQVGDGIRAYGTRQHAELTGVIIKVGRSNVTIETHVRFSPTGPLFRQEHKVPIGEINVVVRDGAIIYDARSKEPTGLTGTEYARPRGLGAITRPEMAQLVEAWNAGRDAGNDPRVRQMVAHEIARINQAFSKLPVRVQFVDHDPYQSFEQMRDQIRSTGIMYVWKGASETPLWDPLTNWKARAVHDWDHIVHTLDFSMEGEAAAFRKSAERTPGLEQLYLSEIMLQAAVQNYTGNFSAQKLVLVSPDVLRKAGQMRGLGTSQATAAKALQSADVVTFVSGLLQRRATLFEVLLHLRAMGYGADEAFVILDAAKMLATQEVAAVQPARQQQHMRGLGSAPPAQDRLICPICGRGVARDPNTGRIARHGYKGGAGMGGGACPTSGWVDARAAVDNALGQARKYLALKEELIAKLDAGTANPLVQRRLVEASVRTARANVAKLEAIRARLE